MPLMVGMSGCPHRVPPLAPGNSPVPVSRTGTPMSRAIVTSPFSTCACTEFEVTDWIAIQESSPGLRKANGVCWCPRA